MNDNSVDAYTEIDHTADAAYSVGAPTREGLYEHAAFGLSRLAGIQMDANAVAVRETISVSAEDEIGLLVAWLNELLWLSESRGLAAKEISNLELSETKLVADLRLQPIQSVQRPLKAVTYSGLKILRRSDGYHATLVVDR
jgi:SHS2 domain-containing protein